MTAAYWPAVATTSVSWFWAPLLPAIALFYLGATVHSAIATLARPRRHVERPHSKLR